MIILHYNINSTHSINKIHTDAMRLKTLIIITEQVKQNNKIQDTNKTSINKFVS